jgi:hypothetical protein|tara:strand:- start:20 stop:199 length:180 start_codon:yes stop_codon:yes gene_type:complete
MMDKTGRILIFKTNTSRGSQLNQKLFDTKGLDNSEKAVEVKHVDLLSNLKAVRDYKLVI